MEIIKKDPTASGGRPPLQQWDKPEPPAGYAIVQCDTSPFYAFRGFVDITLDALDEDVCIGMTGNQEALDTYLLEHPDTEETATYTETEITQQEITDLQLENIEQGQEITDLWIAVLEGKA